MGKPTGFLEYNRETAKVLPPKVRIANFKEFRTPLNKEKQKLQGARCMACGVPFCQAGMMIGGMASGCPLHNLVPETNDLVFTGNWKQAFLRLNKTHSFPEFTSRVCPALCEAACTCNLNGEPVSTKENERAIIETAYAEGWVVPQPPKVRTGKTIAVIGSGPSGLFCAYMLAKAGYKPILLERGASVEERTKDVERFWKTGQLDPESNVQFGEGGAGTFSDGKLNTLVKDTFGRNRKVLEIFVEHGAPEEILYVNKPHIGTDILTTVVKKMRDAIVAAGGEVHFHSKVTDLQIQNHCLQSVTVNGKHEIPCNIAILAIGHSARDTFQMLYEKGIPMEPKSFAVGVRVEHKQTMINLSQYGMEENSVLPAASYKVAEQLSNGRGVYSFCMCPGGYVVNASSEEEMLAVNGMSYHDRAGRNSNTALITTVTPEDFSSDSPLAGLEFQRKYEKLAYKIGNGKIPVQLFGDFLKNQMSTKLGKVTPSIKGEWQFANLHECLPDYVCASLEEGMRAFGHKIKGYDAEDTVFSGVETRTSSPLRMERNKQFESNIQGLFPCGEGAGYAGGITSAAMDGIKTAEAIAEKILTQN